MHRGNEKLKFMANLGNGESICLAGEREGAQSAEAGIQRKRWGRLKRVLNPVRQLGFYPVGKEKSSRTSEQGSQDQSGISEGSDWTVLGKPRGRWGSGGEENREDTTAGYEAKLRKQSKIKERNLNEKGYIGRMKRIGDWISVDQRIKDR